MRKTIITIALAFMAFAAMAQSERASISFNEGWKVAFGDL